MKTFLLDGEIWASRPHGVLELQWSLVHSIGHFHGRHVSLYTDRDGDSTPRVEVDLAARDGNRWRLLVMRRQGRRGWLLHSCFYSLLF